MSFYSQLYIVTNGRVKWAVGRVLTRGWCNDSFLCAGEGSDREMGFINSEPALQEFMPHSLDAADNTPPPAGDTRPHVTRDPWHATLLQGTAGTGPWTAWWRACPRWPWCRCTSSTPGWRRRSPHGNKCKVGLSLGSAAVFSRARNKPSRRFQNHNPGWKWLLPLSHWRLFRQNAIYMVSRNYITNAKVSSDGWVD